MSTPGGRAMAACVIHSLPACHTCPKLSPLATRMEGGSARGVVHSQPVRHVGAALRATALAALTLQNGVQALLVRFSKEHRPPGQLPYLGSSVVFVVELVKLGAAAVMLQRTQSLAPLLEAQSWRASFLFAPPAAVYAVQNNLLLVAARALDPPTFLVLSQCKILTTAGFSLALLGRRLHRVRWCVPLPTRCSLRCWISHVCP